jgi:hypothetical protein
VRLLKNTPAGYQAYEISAKEAEAPSPYIAGEILIFPEEAKVKPGNEIAVADNEETAIEYLQELLGKTEEALPLPESIKSEYESQIQSLSKQLSESRRETFAQKEKVAELSRKLAQKDIVDEEALSDIAGMQELLQSSEIKLESTFQEYLDLQGSYVSAVLDVAERDHRIEELVGQVNLLSVSAKKTPQVSEGKHDADVIQTSSGKVRIVHEYATLTADPDTNVGKRRWLNPVRLTVYLIIFLAIVMVLAFFLTVFHTMTLDGIDVQFYVSQVWDKILALFGR